MLLNIFLGLIATITLVFGDCDFGTQGTEILVFLRLVFVY